jgi:NMD protein affecting ribosome stability and mRNA decay
MVGRGRRIDMEYTCYVLEDGYEEVVEAASAEEAARLVVDVDAYRGDTTIHYRVRVREMSEDQDAVTYTVSVHPLAPPCIDGQDHDWQAPWEVLGGCAESPGVQAHGGGVYYTEVCAHCGLYRHTDTWAQAPWGEQGLREIRYAPPDDDSRRWVNRGETASS